MLPAFASWRRHFDRMRMLSQLRRSPMYMYIGYVTIGSSLHSTAHGLATPEMIRCTWICTPPGLATWRRPRQGLPHGALEPFTEDLAWHGMKLYQAPRSSSWPTQAPARPTQGAPPFRSGLFGLVLLGGLRMELLRGRWHEPQPRPRAPYAGRQGEHHGDKDDGHHAQDLHAIAHVHLAAQQQQDAEEDQQQASGPILRPRPENAI